MVKITCYGGVSEIGGNKILVEDEDTRVLLDFGTRMGYESNFFSEFLNPRSNTKLKDKLALGVLPKIPGIYRDDLVKPIGIGDLENNQYKRILTEDSDYFYLEDVETYNDYFAKKKKPFVNAILLSHAHYDHTGAIGNLDTSIPLYCSQETKMLIEVIDEVTKFKSEAIETTANKIKFVGPTAKFPGSPGLEHKEKYQRDCHGLEDGENVKVGNLNIRIITQDHSVPGASSFVLESSGKKILYTGDIRFHGTYPMTIDEYVQKVGKGISIMLCEGTRIESEKKITESEIKDKISDKISKTEGLVFIDFSWKDTTRYETIRDAAKKAGRIFVINARLAYILDKMGKYPKESNVKVFLKRKGSCLYSPSDYTREKHELGLSVDWSKDVKLIHYENGLTAEDIKAHPEKYVMMLSYYDLGQLFDLADKNGEIPNSWFIKAQCEPFSDEMELDEERFINWLDAFGIEFDPGETPLPDGCTNPECQKLHRRIDRSHVSGHASRPELKELIEKIRPKVLIPIHTEHPDKFEELVEEIGGGIGVIIPKENETYTF